MSTMSNTTDNLLYIVNRGENNGYAIIAGDNRVSPILAFSETGSLTQTDLQRHPALNWMLSEYEKQIKWAMTHLSDRPFKATARKADANRTPIEPLLEYENDRKTRRERPIQWGQGWPFNAYTPQVTLASGDLHSCPTGCVATAIATVMRWHKWPKKPVGTTGYWWNGNYLGLDFNGAPPENSAYDWEQMPETPCWFSPSLGVMNLPSALQADNIGRLLRDVGYSLGMDYGTFGSSTRTEYWITAAHENFGYKKSIKNIERKDFTPEGWENEIYDELSNYGPIIYVGTADTTAHCFVVDGWKSGNYLHIDWGWDGSFNGWFQLNAFNVPENIIQDGSYNRRHRMLRFVKPDREDDAENGILYASGKDLYSPVMSTQIVRQENFQKVIINIANRDTLLEYKGQLALSLRKKGGNSSNVVATTTATIEKDNYKHVLFYANLATYQEGEYEMSVGYADGNDYTDITTVGTLFIHCDDTMPEPSEVTDGNDLYAMSMWMPMEVLPDTKQALSACVGNFNPTLPYSGTLGFYASTEENGEEKAVIIGSSPAYIPAGGRVVVEFEANLGSFKPGRYLIFVKDLTGEGQQDLIRANAFNIIGHIGEDSSIFDHLLTVNQKSDEKIVTQEGMGAKIEIDVQNNMPLEYADELFLYVKKPNEEMQDAVQISSGNVIILPNQSATITFYTNNQFKTLAAGEYTLVLEAVKNGSRYIVGQDFQTVVVNKKTVNMENDVRLHTAFFYQGGKLIGSDNAAINKYVSSTFTVRYQLYSENGFKGQVRAFIASEKDATTAAQNRLEKTYTINVPAGEYYTFDVTYSNSNLYLGHYFVKLAAKATNETRWKTGGEAVAFSIKRSYYSSNSKETVQGIYWGPVYVWNDDIKSYRFQSVGNEIQDAITITDIEDCSLKTENKAETKVRYNLNGQRVGENYKGIVVENGKKILK